MSFIEASNTVTLVSFMSISDRSVAYDSKQLYWSYKLEY